MTTVDIDGETPGPKATATLKAFFDARTPKDEDFLGIGSVQGGPLRLWYGSLAGVLSTNFEGGDVQHHPFGATVKEQLVRNLWKAADAPE